MDDPNRKQKDAFLEKKSKKKTEKKKKKSKHAKNKPNDNGRELFSNRGASPAATAKSSVITMNEKRIVEQEPPGSHPFPVDDSDHCETPLQAYRDLEVVLDRLLWMDDDDASNDATGNNNVSQPKNSPRKKRSRSELTIYDPYYCDGGVKTKLASMGFTNVINRNRDFYQDIASGEIPEYDVLVTNPPYSGEHMERILKFCSQQSQSSRDKKKKAFFLLLPHFVYTKDYYQRALASSFHTSTNSFFYFLVPEIRYAYIPPAWVAERSGASKALVKGKETTAPFPSFWYCHGPSPGNRNRSSPNPNPNPKHKQKPTSSSEPHHDEKWLEKIFGPTGSFRSKHESSRLRYARVEGDIPRDFKGEFDATKRRPNPRARKRQRQKQQAVRQATPAASTRAQQQQHQQQPKKKKKRRY